jgi:hypothetical protein
LTNLGYPVLYTYLVSAGLDDSVRPMQRESHMNVDSLKKQASRLASYLSKKHRMNLKHASALEAIAAVHGARNWPTLAAQGTPAEPTPQRQRGRPQVGRDGVFPLTWHADAPQMTLPASDWFQHTLATGESSLRREWLVDHLLHCHRTAAGGVFINVLDREGLAPIVDMHHEEAESATLPQYNLLAGLTPDEIIWVLMFAYPIARDFPIRSFIREQCRAALQLILPKDIPTGEALSLTAVLLILEPQALALRAQADVEFGTALRTVTGASPAMTGDELRGPFSQVFGPLTRELRAVQRTPLGQAMFSNVAPVAGEVRSVVDCFCREDLLHVVVPEAGPAAHTLRQLWMETLVLASRRVRNSSERGSKAHIFGLHDCSRFSGAALLTLAEQSRSVDLALLLTERTERHIRATHAGQKIVQNIRNHLHLGVPDEDLRAELLRRLDESRAQLRTPSGVSFG